MQTKKIFNYDIPGKSETWCRLLSSTDGCVLEVYRSPHRPQTGLQVQRARHGITLPPPQFIHSGPRQRRCDQHAVTAHWNMVLEFSYETPREYSPFGENITVWWVSSFTCYELIASLHTNNNILYFLVEYSLVKLERRTVILPPMVSVFSCA